MSESYTQLLRDPRWQRKRLEILQRDEFTCFECEDSETTLHVHHRYYVPKRAPWDYPLFAYVTLCKDCHESKKHDANIQSFETIIQLLTGGDPLRIEMMLESVQTASLRPEEMFTVVRRSIDYYIEAGVMPSIPPLASPPEEEQIQTQTQTTGCCERLMA